MFLHLPKCGGTALHEWLASVVGPDELCPERNRMPADLPDDRVDSFRGYRVFSGHFDPIDATHFPTPQLLFTVFRDPIDRIVSLYDFWRAHDDAFIDEHDLAGPRFAAAVSFEEFVSAPDPTVVPDLDNTMVRTFTGAIRHRDPIPDPDAALAEAIAVVAGFAHVGHVADLEPTVVWLRQALGLPSGAGGGLERANVRGEWDQPHMRNVDRTVVTPAAAAALEPLVHLDRRLVNRFTTTK